MPVLAENVVATSQPLAAQAGLRMLLQGGNAVDAAVATAITLVVVEPVSNGIGADAFALVWDGERLNGLNASGRSPRAWSPAHFEGLTEMPQHGWDSVTVPGAVSAWAALSRTYGRLEFAQLFEPAIRYARDGFAVGPVTAQAWEAAARRFDHYPGFREAFMPDGRSPQPGQPFACPAQAATLEKIASSGGEALYRGDLAAEIGIAAAAGGGVMTESDLASHQAEWVEPVGQEYRGYVLHEIPPNGQGLAALLALGILSQHDVHLLDTGPALHLQIEAMKLALADARRYVADPAWMDVRVDELLAPGYLADRARMVNMDRAGTAQHGSPERGGTVYLATADAGGMMVSCIQSNYMGFGSGIVVPRTGIALQNRGAGFCLQPGHPNQVAGGKRPFHTIIPAFLSQDGRPVMSFGVMGGPMQAQGHVQMVVRLVDYHQNPQAAADAPRWQVLAGNEVAVEQGFGPDVLGYLRSRGHCIRERERSTPFGGAQLICRSPAGYCAASEPRKEGQAVGF